MRILFILIGNSRRSNFLNSYNLRYGGAGGSGTDSSTIMIAEYLAKQGHDIVIAFEKMEAALESKYEKFIPGSKINNIQYTYIDTFEGITNKTFDILVSSLWFEKYEDLPIKITRSLIYWSHMQWIYGINHIEKYVKKNNLSLGIVNISSWQKNMVHDVIAYLKNNNDKFIEVTIPNPIMDDLILETKAKKINKKKHKFIFHASWARGGNVSYRAVKNLPYEDKEFHAFDYLMTIHKYEDSFFHIHNGVDKSTLFHHIAESEYFIYPLYTMHQDVHKDTFACVVAEALALDTIVVTYPLGALTEYFGDYCVFLNMPKDTDRNIMQSEALSKDIDGKFNVTDNIEEKIKYLENNPLIKDTIRLNCSRYILDTFNVDNVGKKWDSLLNMLLSIH